jgi:site-specific recombinase XerD
MNKNRAENLTMNRKFFNWCKHADGKSDSSRKKIAYDIQPFTDFMGTKSYKMITSELIMEFKEELKESGISIAAYCSKLRSTRKELGYLMSQPGYKSKITPALIKYMSPTDEEIRMAQIRDDRNIMPLESVIALHESIPNDTPIGMRDRAIISLLITTGIRHKALITMPFGYIHLEKGFIYQDPRAGVKTKFRKKIKAAICNLDDRFTQSLKDWDNYLRANCFGTNSPFFTFLFQHHFSVEKCPASS